MKNRIFKPQHIFFLLGLFMLSSCNERWDEMNTNPNKVIDLPDGYLFTSAIRGTFRDALGRVQADYSGQYAHIVTTDVFNREIDKYFDIHSSGDVGEGIYSDIYNGALLNITEVLNLTKEGKYKNEAKHAQAKVIAAYNFSKLTDLFGDVPFSEASQGKTGQLKPKYEEQETIYGELIRLLSEALVTLENPGSDEVYSQEYDPFYNGNMEHWKKFANSLRLRLAMRARLVDPGKYEPIIAASLMAPLIETNEENATLTHFDSDNSELYNPWYNEIIDYNANRFNMLWSEMFIETLQEANDPRLPFFATKNRNDEFLGMPNGLEDIPYSQWAKSNTSRFTAEFVARDQPLYIMTAAEVWLLRAEAALFSIGTGEDANALYQKGIRIAMEQWNINLDEVETFILQEESVLNGSQENKLRQIATQLWIACIPNFLESWNTIRRTGYPKIEQRAELRFSKGVTNGIVPKRLRYPYTVEKITNGINLQEALDRMGGTDDISHPVWWDIKD